MTDVQCYIKAVEAEPEAHVWICLGGAGGGHANGIDVTVVQCFENAVAADPFCAMAWCTLGEVGGGIVNGARMTDVQCFAKAVEIEPGCAVAKATAEIGLKTCGS